MAPSVSEAKRRVVVELLKQGLSQSAIFKQLQPAGYSLSFVKRAIRRWRTEGTTSDKQKTGRVRSVRTKALIKRIAMRMQRSPLRRSSRMAAQLNVSQATVYRVLTEDLGLRAFRRHKCQLIPARAVLKRLHRCRLLLRRHVTGPLVFSDEKKWTVQEVHNAQNDRLWARSMEEAVGNDAFVVSRAQAPAHVMVWAAISERGKLALEFLDSERLTGKKYIDKVLKPALIPAAKDQFADEAWCFQQDGAPCHRAQIVQDFLAGNVPDFLDKDEWPPHSPDLNPLDFYLWGRLEGQVNTKRFSSVDELKAKIRAAWEALDDAEVGRACAQFRTRLTKCVRSGGKYFSMD